MISRREFITLLGGAAAAWPVAARGQQAAMPVVGFLGNASPEQGASLAGAARRGLEEAGYIDGRNLKIEYRWSNNQESQLAGLAADLVRRDVSAIMTTFSRATLVAKSATSKIPIIFATANDPVQVGLVASLNRPGGNITGVSYLSGSIGEKRLGLLLEVARPGTAIAVLTNPSNLATEANLRNVQEAAAKIGLRLSVFTASHKRNFAATFVALDREKIGGLEVLNDPLFLARRTQIAALANKYAIPTIYTGRNFAVAGGLISYGADLKEVFRQVGLYTARILKGEPPENLPVVQPTKFEMVINLQTAKALGIEIPAKLLFTADEVIE